MAEQPKPPIVKTPIPPVVINEGAAYGPLDLKDFIVSPDDLGGDVHFVAGLDSGDSLPDGLICTGSGFLGGIPAVGTIGSYKVVLIAENESEDPLITEFPLTIKARTALDDPTLLTNLKAEVWKALEQNLPIPDLKELLSRPVTADEIFYLLQRYATFTIWDIYNLDPPGEKVILNLPGASPHYVIYDCGSCIVGAPKDLYSHQRTLEDALQTSRVIAAEVYKRGWTIEFAGFGKMIRAAWIELQMLADKHGKQLEIVHFTPTQDDMKLYTARVQNKGPSL